MDSLVNKAVKSQVRTKEQKYLVKPGELVQHLEQ